MSWESAETGELSVSGGLDVDVRGVVCGSDVLRAAWRGDPTFAPRNEWTGDVLGLGSLVTRALTSLVEAIRHSS